jgi:hypothetical protein
MVLLLGSLTSATFCCTSKHDTLLLPAQGYAERKVLLLGAVLAAVKAIHSAAAKQERARLHSACRQVGCCGVCLSYVCSTVVCEGIVVCVAGSCVRLHVGWRWLQQ